MNGGRIGVGLVGLGNSGWHYRAEGTIERSRDFELVAVSGRTAERTAAAAARFDARAHPDWESLLADDRVEVVVVATPHDLHAPIAIRALEAGRHVVVEKPMAMTRAETDAMIAAATASDRLLTVFQNRRWEPSFQLIRRLVADGEIGDGGASRSGGCTAGSTRWPGRTARTRGPELAGWAHGAAGGGGVTAP